MKKNQPGFTLIELLVVIAIIGLLSTLSILALNTARARARDTKRVADVKQIQTALEMYYNDMGAYPATASVVASSSIYTSNGVYMKSIPTPPTPIDGSACTAAPNYTYTMYPNVNGGGTYSIKYCLGSDVNNLPGNQILTASEAGMK